MTSLAFIGGDPADPAWRSPLERALSGAPAAIRDVSDEAQDGLIGRAGGIAGIEIEGRLARKAIARLTAIQPPAIGAVAGVRAEVAIVGDDRYRLWCAQEYGDYLARAVLDVWKGLE